MNEQEHQELISWGWNTFFEQQYLQYPEGYLRPSRVVRDTRHLYTLRSGSGEAAARVSGAFRYTAVRPSDYPVVGDWVLCRQEAQTWIIEQVMKRSSQFSRKAPGSRTEEQVSAANIDITALVFGLNGGRNFTPGSLERYLTLAWESGSEPIIVLNKADLADAQMRSSALQQAVNSAPGVRIFSISASTGEGLSELEAALRPGTTAALLGPSGVGKSTLINSLAGRSLQKTAAQRTSDQKGKHTTTARELFKLPSGAMIIDTPGLKELQLIAGEESTAAAFSDIEELAQHCRYDDCSHEGEPGCAVQAALACGELEQRRYEQYLDIRKEIRYVQRRFDEQSARQERDRWKQIAKRQKELNKLRKR
jgi:ribosome biogenesis GTPase / thiamine phosphate phosphatase